ncbi:unnamed protein product [Lactuca virosa]|uniref:Uncharacterized protein n=1 Tax=Lactuca virosa TaxID=75947 RepID=A0AAU9MNX5_9ASTR|nr:unnamed protein product [Lactuca virosa]
MTEVIRILESVLECQPDNTLKTFTMETRSEYFLPDATLSSSVVNSINPTNPELATSVGVENTTNTDLFEMYFKMADLDKDGRINGVEAVPFFQTTGLPKAILAKIWSYVDVNRNSYLNRSEFDNYLKLVTVAQSKRELTPDIVKAALYGPASTKIPAPQIDVEALAIPQQNLKMMTVETRSKDPLPDTKLTNSAADDVNPSHAELAARVENTDLFEMYFKIADLNNDGRISGVEAVQFFQTSGLPKAILAKIWSYADLNRNSYLNRSEFNNYLKLVTVAQSKRELTPDIVKAALYGPVSPKIPAPRIDLEALAIPQQNLKRTVETRSIDPLPETMLSNSAANGVNSSHAEMGHQVINTDLFEIYFKKADLDQDGYVSGAEALPFFQASGLPKSVLAHIWRCVDTNQNGYLSRGEFDNYLKLITVAQSKRELTPDMVKAALYGPASAKIPAPNLPQ